MMSGEQSQISFLLSRLTWPSAMVRERTAAAIAELVLGPESDVISTALLNWIAQQKLESVAAIGLLPFCRARSLTPERQLAGDLKQAVRRPSLLSLLLLKELKLDEDGGLTSLSGLHTGTAPEDFRGRPFFGENMRSFLPQIYATRASDIEEEFGVLFTRQWAFEWENLLAAEGIQPSLVATGFWGRDTEWHYSYAGFDLKLSEVYRSAYLRALAWAVETGGPNYESALFLAAETCPIDLALWSVPPGRPPSWWPVAESPRGTVDTVPAQIWGHVKALWEARQSPDQSEAILAAGGRVYEGGTFYDLEILGIFQATRGPARGDTKQVFDWAHGVSVGCSTKPLRFEGTIDSVRPRQVQVQFDDWLVSAACGWVLPPPFSRWQYWRHFRSRLLPTPFWSSELPSFRCGVDAVEVLTDGTVTAWWRDWTDSLTEMLLANLPPRTGYFLTADANLVRNFASRTASNFAWVCRLTGYQRHGSYEKFETFENYQDFGTTGIVMPPWSGLGSN